jgi:hypothetical protein
VVQRLLDSPYAAVPNAFNPAYVSGGSSFGSDFALGTDTAGSGARPGRPQQYRGTEAVARLAQHGRRAACLCAYRLPVDLCAHRHASPLKTFFNLEMLCNS